MDDEIVTTGDLLNAWRDAARAAELAERLTTMAVEASEQAEDDATAAAEVASLTESAAQAAASAAESARVAALRASAFAAQAREHHLRSQEESTRLGAAAAQEDGEGPGDGMARLTLGSDDRSMD